MKIISECSALHTGQFYSYLTVSLGGEFKEDVAAVCGAEHERGGAHARLEGAAHLSARPHGRGLYCLYPLKATRKGSWSSHTRRHRYGVIHYHALRYANTVRHMSYSAVV